MCIKDYYILAGTLYPASIISSLTPKIRETPSHSSAVLFLGLPLQGPLQTAKNGQSYKYQFYLVRRSFPSNVLTIDYTGQ